jgi:hypothetical protein
MSPELCLAGEPTEGQSKGKALPEISMALWGLAKLGEAPMLHLEAIAEQITVQGLADRFNAWSIATVAWAFATLQCRHPAFLEAIADQPGQHSSSMVLHPLSDRVLQGLKKENIH